MKTSLVLLFVLVVCALVSAQPPTFLNSTTCYSPCLSCSQGPYNCTRCSSLLVLLNNRCLLSSKEAAIAQDFFPLTADNNAFINIPTLSQTQYSLENCSYTEVGQVSSGSMYFIKPVTTLERTFSQIPPHGYIRVKFALMQKNWTSGNSVTVSISRQPAFTVDYVAPVTSPVINCNSTATSITQVDYGFSDPYRSNTNTGTLTIGFSSNVSGLEYGVNSLLVLYGNCDRVCDTCSGPESNNCKECRYYLTFVSANNTCSGCDSGFVSIDSICIKCHISCLTCSGPSQTECLTCSDLRSLNSSTKRCDIKDSNYQPVSVQFTSVNFTSNNGWASSSGSTNQSIIGKCGVYNFLLGPGIGNLNTVASKVFSNLSYHFGVVMEFNMILIDSASTSISYQYWADSTVFNGTVSVNGTRSNQCGSSLFKEVFIPIKLTFPHSNSTLSFRFMPNITASNSYGIRDFSFTLQKCPSGCKTCNTSNTSQCLTCDFNFVYDSNKKSCESCPQGYFTSIFNAAPSCEPCSIFCKSCNGPTVRDCLSCDPPLALTGTECRQTSNFGIFSMYANQKATDLNPDKSWSIYPNLQTKGTDKCANYSILGSSEKRYKFLKMSKKFQNLPSHSGISIHFNLFQIDTFYSDSLTFSYDGNLVKYVPVNYGTQICGESTMDALNKITYVADHTKSDFLFEVLVDKSAKFGINNIVVFLRDCAECQVQLDYTVSYIPRYSLNEADKGLDVFLDFNSPSVKNASNVENIFRGFLSPNGSNPDPKSSIPLNLSAVNLQTSIKLFSPLNQTVLNKDLSMLSNYPSLITADLGGQNKPLASPKALSSFIRYDYLDNNSTDRKAIRNIYSFNNGFTNAVLYVSIAAFFFGLTVIFEDFVSILQILFMHIFIATEILPLSYKIPLEGLQNIEFLNYFISDHRKAIESVILPQDFYQRSPPVFAQYYPDTNFIREIYSIMIINIGFLIIYGIVRGLLAYVDELQEPHPNPYVRYFQEMILKPVNYLDYFFRYEFITVVWACILQFFYFTSPFNPFSGINSALCIIFFVAAVAYPIGIAYYLYYQRNFMTQDLFKQLYGDIFYKRLREDQSQTLSNQPFFYILFKFYRLLLICVVVAVPAYFHSPIGSLIPLIIIHAIDLAYVFYFRVFNDWVYLGFKVIENSCLIIIEILYLIVCGQAVNMNTPSFFALGYALDAFVIIAILNAVLRFLYLLYEKIQGFRDYLHEMEMKALQMKPLVNEFGLTGRGRGFADNHVSDLGHQSNISRMKF